jgi:predicted membrane channel-forming protein YqfA (hemolysin III family)
VEDENMKEIKNFDLELYLKVVAIGTVVLLIGFIIYTMLQPQLPIPSFTPSDDWSANSDNLEEALNNGDFDCYISSNGKIYEYTNEGLQRALWDLNETGGTIWERCEVPRVISRER